MLTHELSGGGGAGRHGVELVSNRLEKRSMIDGHETYRYDILAFG